MCGSEQLKEIYFVSSYMYEGAILNSHNDECEVVLCAAHSMQHTALPLPTVLHYCISRVSESFVPFPSRRRIWVLTNFCSEFLSDDIKVH